MHNFQKGSQWDCVLFPLAAFIKGKKIWTLFKFIDFGLGHLGCSTAIFHFLYQSPPHHNVWSALFAATILSTYALGLESF